MKRFLPLLIFLMCAPAFATTWFVRTDGGSRYDASNAPTGQCDGQADAQYPGSGVNQHCAFNDWRYLWDLPINCSTAPSPSTCWGWVIAGGDTVVVRGCAAGPNQSYPSNPNCRVGWDSNAGNSSTNGWCWFAPTQHGYGSNSGCFNPPVPAGSSGAHTRILGGCAYDGNCTPIKGAYPYGTINEAQLFGGFGTQITLDLTGTQYVDVAGLEITTHNDHSQCVQYGSPAYPKGCDSGIGTADDWGSSGIWTDNTSSNITLTNIYLHGFANSGIKGPLGGPITATNVSIDFNGFAGWNFDNFDVANAAGSSITASYVFMQGNGCDEEYPIVHTAFPAFVCYDDSSNGFGDSWSGQDASLDFFYCDHCTQIYNTKDGFIGPHTIIADLRITNSQSYANMGQQWKWTTGNNSNLLFQNNISIGDCTRMSEPIAGASFVSHLSDFCRAAGDLFSLNVGSNSTQLYAGNTVFGYNPAIFDFHCLTANACASSPAVLKDNIINGYTTTVDHYPNSGEAPGLYFYSDATNTVTASYQIENGIRSGDTCGLNHIICSDPLLTSEPAQGAYPPAAVFDALVSGLYYPTNGSPAIGAGIAVSGLTTDLYGAGRPNPPSMGAVEPASSPSSGTSLGGSVKISGNVCINKATCP